MILSRWFSDYGLRRTHLPLHCQQLELASPIQFEYCDFPNLRSVRLTFTPSESYRPFNQCRFHHPVNLIFEQAIEIELPSDLLLQSIEVLETPVQLRQNDQTTTVNEIGWVPNEYHSTVQVKYGTETSQLLDDHSVRFDRMDLELESDPQIIMQPTRLTVRSQGRSLGTIQVEIDDHPFSLALLQSDGPFIHFDQDVPEDWSSQAHPSALERVSQIRGLTILGTIGSRAFVDLELEWHTLEVSGAIASKALVGCRGRIDDLIVGQLLADSFEGAELQLGRVHLNLVEEGVKIEAEVVSVKYCSQLHAVDDAKTLVIREKFDAPIGLVDKSTTKIDFRTVGNLGPYLVQLDGRELVFLQPTVHYEPIFGMIKAPSRQAAHQKLFRIIRSSFPEVTRPEQLQVSWNDELSEVRLDGKVVARHAIQIQDSDRSWIYGLWALTLAVGALTTFY